MCHVTSIFNSRCVVMECTVHTVHVFNCIYYSTCIGTFLIGTVEQTRCNGGTFDNITCGNITDSVIQVTNVLYGDTGSSGLCSDDVISIYDCRVQVEAEYMDEIRSKCYNLTTCDNLTAKLSNGTYCNPDRWPNTFSEYVMLVYRCIPGDVSTTTLYGTYTYRVFQKGVQSTDNNIKLQRLLARKSLQHLRVKSAACGIVPWFQSAGQLILQVSCGIVGPAQMGRKTQDDISAGGGGAVKA